MQIDVTATPRHTNGAIFVQTVSDYPLVEAISQNIVKHPVLPDAASRAKLNEKKSSKYSGSPKTTSTLAISNGKKSTMSTRNSGRKQSSS